MSTKWRPLQARDKASVSRGPIRHVNWFNHMIANHMVLLQRFRRRSAMKTAVALGVLVACLACSEALIR